jgi:hypothetical protein
MAGSEASAAFPRQVFHFFFIYFVIHLYCFANRHTLYPSQKAGLKEK